MRSLTSPFTSIESFVMSNRKAPRKDENPNSDFCEFLFELANYEKNVNGNQYKYNAYRKAAGTLAEQSKRIESGAEARKLNGIGEKIAKKIDEFIETGKLKKIENIRNDDKSTAISLLTRVNGIGPAKAKDLVEKDGIFTIEDLQNNLDKLTHAQQLGVKHFEDFEKRIPRREVSQIERVVYKELLRLDPRYTLTICGSYRRGLPTSGDVDILLTHDDYNSATKASEGANRTSYLRRAVDALENANIITDTLSHGSSKFMGVCRLDSTYPFRRLDILLLPKDQYYCGVLYFTGSDIFNKKMRSKALEEGFTLNEHAIRPIDVGSVPLAPLPVSSEMDIFDYISFEYKRPEDRSL